MAVDPLPALAALNQRFLVDYPHEAARELEAMTTEDAAELLAAQPPRAVVGAWQALMPDIAREVIAMVAAGLAGALVPILLHRFGQDPATASSIILTTVTDVVGFFSFLGIATLLATMLG